MTTDHSNLSPNQFDNLSLEKIEEILNALSEASFGVVKNTGKTRQMMTLRNFLVAIIRVRQLEVELEIARRDLYDAKMAFNRSKDRK